MAFERRERAADARPCPVEGPAVPISSDTRPHRVVHRRAGGGRRARHPQTGDRCSNGDGDRARRTANVPGDAEA
jgi:hypothetical protein